ncbi:DUF551 domain-containing protein [Klebsiella quasipneumoniae]|uniref:DUF551 domain-containing protein n=1 Tax=Klebsiella quasipneumoniae TaxID=1463165 RepID=UPI00249CE5BF|nr:DUF551 domain-containing protein [Klebsiella quasipneumoniae]MDI3084855.1 DUF551 domain-containing protein [Klebsiella quasipneumoniae]
MKNNQLTKERLQEIAEDGFLKHGESKELARMALAALDSEPDRNPVLAYADSYRDMAKQGVESVPIWSVITDLERNIAPLYRHAQQPVVPDDVLDALQKVARLRLDLNDFDGDRRGIADCLCDAEEALIEVVNCRAAMLQAYPVCTCPSGDGSLRRPCPVHPGNSPTQSDCCPAQNSVTPAQNSVTPAQNSVTPAQNQGWIPVSEQMPEVGDIVLTAMGGVVNVGETECSAANCRFFTSVISGRELPATHWMPLPAAPQEVSDA